MNDLSVGTCRGRHHRRVPHQALALEDLAHQVVRAVERCGKSAGAARCFSIGGTYLVAMAWAGRLATLRPMTRALHMITADALTSVRELDCRCTNGLQVRLLWCESDGRVSVAVVDTRSRESFRLDVPDGERPLDVFYHPFAYAAVQRVRRDSGERIDPASGSQQRDNGVRS